MQTRPFLQRRRNPESSRLVAKIQPRSWSDSSLHQQAIQPQSVNHDFSHVDLFAHDPGPRSIPHGIQAKPFDTRQTPRNDLHEIIHCKPKTTTQKTKPKQGLEDVTAGVGATEIRIGDKGQQVSDKDRGIRRIAIQVDSGHQAIVLLSSKLDPTASVDILLHFHGFRNSNLNRGYAGDTLKDVGEDQGVRDIEKDQIEQQLLANGHTQTIAILPQSKSNATDFSGANNTTYIDNVFVALNNQGVWGKTNGKPITAKPNYKVILSAHSGGGAKLSGNLLRRDNPGLGNVKGAFLFDAINALGVPKKNPDGSIATDDKGKIIRTGTPDTKGSNELKGVQAFVKSQLDLELAKLDELTKLPDGKPNPNQKLVSQNQSQWLEQNGFRLRGYYTPGWYERIYAPLAQDLETWFNQTVVKKRPNLDAAVIKRWSKNYAIQAINAVSKVGKVGKGGHQGHEYDLGQGIPASSKDYDPAKGGALQDALGSIQPKLAVGAYSTQSFVQRQGASAGSGLTDAEQWEQDWIAHPDKQRNFAGSGRPAGTPRQRYDVLCPLYKAHGIPRPMVYVATSIATATFYSSTTPAHKDLVAPLAAAEKVLKDKGYVDAPFKKMWAFNPRTTSKGGWSNHATGRAIDFDEATNPHLIDQKERKIISLVTGTDMEKGGQGYDVMKGASDTFKADYNSAGLARRIAGLTAAEKGKETERDAAKSDREALKGQRDTLQTERNALNKQLKAIPQGKKATAADVAKAMTLKATIQQKDTELKQIQTTIKQKDVDLKKTESGLKSATKDRQLLQKQLTTYQTTEKAIADLESAVQSLPSEITSIEAQINQSKQDEQDAKTAKDLKGVAAQQKLRVTLQKSLAQKKFALKKQQAQLDARKKQRDADPLRQYATTGFLDLPKDMVNALTGAGLGWGGDWKGAKDFMHFELPNS